MSVCLSFHPSVRPYGTSRIPLKHRKSPERIVILLKSNKHNGASRDYLRTVMIISRRVLLRMINDQSCRENQHTHFRKISPLEIMWKICVRGGHTTDDNVIRRISQNLYYLLLSTTKMVKRTHHVITLYVDCLACCLELQSKQPVSRLLSSKLKGDKWRTLNGLDARSRGLCVRYYPHAFIDELRETAEVPREDNRFSVQHSNPQPPNIT